MRCKSDKMEGVKEGKRERVTERQEEIKRFRESTDEMKY